MSKRSIHIQETLYADFRTSLRLPNNDQSDPTVRTKVRGMFTSAFEKYDSDEKHVSLRQDLLFGL
jgi:hypothetical protein